MEIKLTEPTEFNYSELSDQQKELALNSAIYIKQRHQLIWENIIAIGGRAQPALRGASYKLKRY